MKRQMGISLAFLHRCRTVAMPPPGTICDPQEEDEKVSLGPGPPMGAAVPEPLAGAADLLSPGNHKRLGLFVRP